MADDKIGGNVENYKERRKKALGAGNTPQERYEEMQGKREPIMDESLRRAKGAKTEEGALAKLNDTVDRVLANKTAKPPEDREAPDQLNYAGIFNKDGRTVEISGLEAQALVRVAIANAAADSPDGAIPSAENVKAKVKESFDTITASAKPKQAIQDEIIKGLVELRAKDSFDLAPNEKLLPKEWEMGKRFGLDIADAEASAKVEKGLDEYAKLPKDVRTKLEEDPQLAAKLLTSVSLGKNNPATSDFAIKATAAVGNEDKINEAIEELRTKLDTPVAAAPKNRKAKDLSSLVNPGDHPDFQLTDAQMPREGGMSPATVVAKEKATANKAALLDPKTSLA